MIRNLQLGAIAIVTAALVGISLYVAQSLSQDDVTPIAEHMHGHLDRVIAMKAAVISGDLAGVYAPANWLAEHQEPPDLARTWKPFADGMRDAARRASEAKDLATAATAIGDIGRYCGECHVAGGFAVSFGYSQPPPEDLDNTLTQMQRHLWASDRLWAGLIGPSDAAWESGANMLTGVDLSVADITADQAMTPLVNNIVQRLRSVGDRGGATPAGARRAELYGEFLALCANCHSLTGGGPGT
jgi:mono/diheme cytochrome c family protein